MLRILHIVTHMNRGGLETMIMNYYRHMDREQVQFDFLVHREMRGDYDDEIEQLGGKIYRLPKLNPFSYRYKESLKEFFATHREYRIVHAHLDCMSAIPLRIAKDCGVSICIAHSHSSSQDYNLKYILKLYYKKKIPKYADRLFACSEKAGQWMFPGQEFGILPNAIDAQSFCFSERERTLVREELGIGQNELVIGHVGRFCEVKNHSFLLDIFASIHKKEDEARLLLVGTGELLEAMKRKADDLGLRDRITFAGLRSDVARLLSAMDLFVFPSLYEGLPVTLIEAQASGLCCFISDSVTKECAKTNLVYQLSLDENAEMWADTIMQHKFYDRRDTYQEICDAGFDIRENASTLQAKYQGISQDIAGGE